MHTGIYILVYRYTYIILYGRTADAADQDVCDSGREIHTTVFTQPSRLFSQKGPACFCWSSWGLVVWSFVPSCARSFDRSFDLSFVRSFVRLVVRSFAHSSACSFVRLSLLLLRLILSFFVVGC